MSAATRARVAVVAALTAVWVLLWGDARPIVVAGGVAVAVVVTALFPFPPVELQAAVRPWRVAVLAAAFLRDLVVASAQVSWLVLRPRPLPAPALIEVRLVSRSEALQVLTGELVSLVPGSLLIELDSVGGRMWLHVLDAGTPERIERARRQARGQEDRVLAAFGSREERDLSRSRLRDDEDEVIGS